MDRLLDVAISGHGGMERWMQVRSIELVASIDGTLSETKGYPEGLKNIRVLVDPAVPYTVFDPFPDLYSKGIFRPDWVSIESREGATLDQRVNPRASFEGHSLQTKWDQTQRLYFFGYAMWNYLCTPFMLTGAGFRSREIEPHEENGELWRRLHVEFPDTFPTHCREQTFYFNDKGLLQRVDYQTDIAGGVAAHYCFDHKTFGGIVVPTRRRVVRRDPNGRAELSGPSRVFLSFTEVTVA